MTTYIQNLEVLQQVCSKRFSRFVVSALALALGFVQKPNRFVATIAGIWYCRNLWQLDNPLGQRWRMIISRFAFLKGIHGGAMASPPKRSPAYLLIIVHCSLRIANYHELSTDHYQLTTINYRRHQEGMSLTIKSPTADNLPTAINIPCLRYFPA